MALTKDKKQEVIQQVGVLLSDSKMTVVAAYKDTPVKAMQDLRRAGKANGTTFKVIKNRLFKKALEKNETLKNAGTDEITGMLLYAFNGSDEVAPAQTIAGFAKKQPTLEFVGAYSSEGKFLSADEVRALSLLPGREELIAEVAALLASPLNDTVSGLSGGLHGILDAVAAKKA